MLGQTQNHETSTKMHAPSNNDSKPQIHTKSNRKHLYETSNPKNAHEHEKQCKLQANCNTDSYAKKLKESRGDVEETEAMPSKPWQPQGGIGNPRSPREAWEAVGRPGSWEGSSIWKHSGWSQATSKNSKNMKKPSINMKKHDKT